MSYPADPLALDPGPVDMKVVVDKTEQQFFIRQTADWQAVGPVLDASLISDEAGRGEHASFTGAFVGMCAFDQTGLAKSADFFHFCYDPT